MMPTKQELEKMKAVDIRNADKNELVDIRDITIDINKSAASRVSEYIEKVKNPFLVKVGDYVVKLNYSDTEETLDDRMKQYIARLAEIKF